MGLLRRWMILLILTGLLAQETALSAAAAEAGVHMNVGHLDQKTASFAVGETHKWYIRAELPRDMGEVTDLTLFQTLSPGLTLEPASVNLSLYQENGEQILLRLEEHYTVTAGSVFVEGGTADRLCVSLSGEGLAFLSEYGMPGAELTASYQAKIDKDAPMGTQILGMAQMNLTNRAGEKQILFSDKAAAATGGFRLQMTDPGGTEVEGAGFMLAREATREEREDPSVEKELLDTGNGTIAVIYECFYPCEDMTGEKTDLTVTDGRGIAGCYGLCYGTYYLVQVRSGREELLTSAPVKAEVNEASHLTAEHGWRDGSGAPVDNTLRVSGISPVMPNTGGPGTLHYTLSGLAVIFSACLLLWNNRKKNPRNG